jgi:hypothetical protein
MLYWEIDLRHKNKYQDPSYEESLINMNIIS